MQVSVTPMDDQLWRTSTVLLYPKCLLTNRLTIPIEARAWAPEAKPYPKQPRAYRILSLTP